MSGGGGDGGSGGREGDWDCSGCGNRNYAFRCFCNRCKQPRLLVDNKTPADSKWLPRIGDWICTGCTNNNYASREKCKKCGQPKEIAAMPAMAIPGASVPTYPNYFARAQGGLDQRINNGLLGNGSLQQSLPLSSNWPFAGADKFGLQPAATWPVNGMNTSGVLHASQANQLVSAPKSWRSGDWICSCGFHNYSSRAQCKKCNTPMPEAARSSFVSTAITAHGTKRVASEELVHEWDSKRLNAGQPAYSGPESVVGPSGSQPSLIYSTFPSASSALGPNLQFNLQVPHVPAAPTLLGKGAKQWRDGDWMCNNCNNHNYASRSECNRCKKQREVLLQQVGVA
ncbi:ranBP2-type zinc finger protein At1g67325-like isoform X1 [Coffea arabica]|uniref:RanBP2-type zinc finger protein At1g67325-like isoform X1 n=1 Tax=Coffea arabica TaxID=13443 RepID=A0A6P6TF55_COFAR|nr:E3 SUMO-protein ligase RanBP2-like isoform X2 [Coffea arabica]XP_027079256.1 E3 SUMO-protein ligase RanBP2-like isoform X2 [Coffea arabica]